MGKLKKLRDFVFCSTMYEKIQLFAPSKWMKFVDKSHEQKNFRIKWVTSWRWGQEREREKKRESWRWFSGQHARLLLRVWIPLIVAYIFNAFEVVWKELDQTQRELGGSPGLVVVVWDSCSKGCEFKSQHCILDGRFSH